MKLAAMAGRGVVLMLSLAAVAHAWAQGPGVSQELAVSRSARVADVRYKLSFTLKAHAAAVTGQELLSFEDRGVW